MLLNYETVIIGPNQCILVPYRREHVQRYHEWMQDPHLLEVTASEPLSLEEEYAMHNTWKNDIHKCTFIILSKQVVIELLVSIQQQRKQENNKNHDISNTCDVNDDDDNYDDLLEALQNSSISAFVRNIDNDDENQQRNTDQPRQRVLPKNFIQDTVPAMIGDVNLFLSPEEEDDDENDNDDTLNGNNSNSINTDERQHHQEQHIEQQQAEIDIMIAEQLYQQKGIGTEVVRLITLYASRLLQIRKFYCKINASNTSSMKLFSAKLQFRKYKFVSCFNEIEYHYKFHTSRQLQNNISYHLFKDYHDCSSLSICTTPTASLMISKEDDQESINKPVANDDEMVTTATTTKTISEAENDGCIYNDSCVDVDSSSKNNSGIVTATSINDSSIHTVMPSFCHNNDDSHSDYEYTLQIYHCPAPQEETTQQ